MTVLLETALPLSALYGLLALGFVITYRSTGVVNFALPGFMVLGGYLGLTLSQHGLSAVVILPTAAAIGFVVGFVFYWLVMRRMAGQPAWAAVLVTAAVGFFIITSVILVLWGPTGLSFGGTLGFPAGLQQLPFGIALTSAQMVLLSAFVGSEVCLLVFYRYARLGIQLRAAAQDHHLASYRSINIDLGFSLAWGASTALAMFVGFAYSISSEMNVGATSITLNAFAAAMAGGMDSVAGVLIGALIVGFAESTAELYFSALLGQIIPYIILLAVLIVRPWGIFGTPELIDRV